MLRKYQAAPDHYGQLKEWARENRKNQTDAESFLWDQIRNKALGVTFLRQFIIEDYIADFICRECNLIIEVDGGYHCQYQQMQDDAIRTHRLNELGYKVIRFKNEEISFEPERILEEIKREVLIYNK